MTNPTRRRAEPHYESAREEEAEHSHCQPHVHRTHHTLLDMGYAYFRERRQREVRRITLLRTPVDRGKKNEPSHGHV